MIITAIEKYLIIAIIASVVVIGGGLKYKSKLKRISELEATIQEYEKQAELAKNAQEQLRLALAEKQKQKDRVITKIVTQVKEVQTTPACDNESATIYEKIRGEVDEFNSK